jgi:hypothetical protein
MAHCFCSKELWDGGTKLCKETSVSERCMKALILRLRNLNLIQQAWERC